MRQSTFVHAWIERSEPVEGSGVQHDSRLGSSYAEATTTKVMPRFHVVGDVDRIVTTWRKLGVDLDPKRVRRHLEGLRNWQAWWVRR